MNSSRREFVSWLALLSMSASTYGQVEMNEQARFGLIGKIIAIPGRREELASMLINGVSAMPGCLSYIVANDESSDNAIWVTEVWQTRAMHAQSLELESVQEAIAKGRPLISGFGERFETQPLGGTGLG